MSIKQSILVPPIPVAINLLSLWVCCFIYSSHINSYTMYSWVWWCRPIIQAMWEARAGRSQVQDLPGQLGTDYLKIESRQRAGDVALCVIEHQCLVSRLGVGVGVGSDLFDR